MASPHNPSDKPRLSDRELVRYVEKYLVIAQKHGSSPGVLLYSQLLDKLKRKQIMPKERESLEMSILAFGLSTIDEAHARAQGKKPPAVRVTREELIALYGKYLAYCEAVQHDAGTRLMRETISDLKKSKQKTFSEDSAPGPFRSVRTCMEFVLPFLARRSASPKRSVRARHPLKLVRKPRKGPPRF